MKISRTRVLTAVAAATVCTVLAACGSTMEPEQLAGAYGVPGAGVQDGVVPGTTGAGVPGVDAGTGTTSGTGASTTGGGASGTGLSTGGTGAGSSSGDGAGGGAGGGSAAPPGADGKAGSCDGFQNGTGITDKTITIGNAADISGPIPGIFESAQQAVKAYVAFFNASSDICGRKLDLVTYDTRTDAGGDQEAATRGCEDAFAMVGSISAFDNGGAATAQKCGIPDMRVASVTPQRGGSPSSFGAQSNATNLHPAAVGNWFKKNQPKTVNGVAMLYSNASAAIVNSKSREEGFKKQGFKVVYSQQVASSEFNYGPYVLEMKEKGVELVHFVGAYPQAIRIAQAMEQQGFEPSAFVLQPAAYDRGFVEGGGEAVDGTYIYNDAGLFEQPTPELSLYLQWLEQVAPGATPTYFGQYAWSAARIFTEQAVKLGGKLNRETLVEAFRGVNNYTANGMHAPQNPGAKKSAECVAMLQVQGDKFVRVSPGRYMCEGLVDSGVGG